jgi:hypothetical protein
MTMLELRDRQQQEKKKKLVPKDKGKIEKSCGWRSREEMIDR